jgi:hypothetical protein
MLRSRHTSVTTADIGCVWIASTLPRDFVYRVSDRVSQFSYDASSQ